jgi:hypothetical protein
MALVTFRHDTEPDVLVESGEITGDFSYVLDFPGLKSPIGLTRLVNGLSDEAMPWLHGSMLWK